VSIDTAENFVAVAVADVVADDDDDVIVVVGPSLQ
jgi:hypothetical protein